MQSVHEIPPPIRAVLQSDPMETEASPIIKPHPSFVEQHLAPRTRIELRLVVSIVLRRNLAEVKGLRQG
jgi:hypothetical protein